MSTRKITFCCTPRRRNLKCLKHFICKIVKVQRLSLKMGAPLVGLNDSGLRIHVNTI